MKIVYIIIIKYNYIQRNTHLFEVINNTNNYFANILKEIFLLFLYAIWPGFNINYNFN